MRILFDVKKNIGIAMSVICFNAAVSYGDDSEMTCGKVIDMWEADNYCKVKWRESKYRLDCIEKIDTLINKHCIGNNSLLTKQIVVRGYLTSALSEKSKDEESKFIADKEIKNSSMINATRITQEEGVALSTAKTELIKYISTIKTLVEDLVYDYQLSIERSISEINNADTLSDLFLTKNSIENRYLEFYNQIHDYYYELRSLQRKAAFIQYRSANRLDDMKDVLFELDLDNELGMKSKYVEKVELYINNTDSSVYAKTQAVLSNIDQKMAIIRYGQADSKHKELAKQYYETMRKHSYYVGASEAVSNFLKVEISTFNNLRYLSNYVKAAEKIAAQSESCDQPEKPSWQDLGCNYILSYKTNAEKALRSTTFSYIQRSTRYFKRIDNNKIKDMLAILDNLVVENDAKGASLLHDKILAYVSGEDK